MTNEEDLIDRMKFRLTQVYKNPNPYIKPLWEAAEINQWIKKLQKLKK